MTESGTSSFRPGPSAFRPAPTTERLGDNDPRVGGELLIDRATWTVGGHATYRNPDYHADEWECRKGATTGYLLKEREGDAVKWFFTLEVPTSAVTLPNTEPIERWRRRETTGGPPPSLRFRGGAYQHETSTEGVYEERVGRSTDKTTWEYWDAGRTHNLAIELWPDGRLDAYHGTYVDPRTIEVRAGRRRVLASAIVVAAFVYCIALLVGVPFDRCTSLSILVLAVMGFVRALVHAPSAAPAGLILAPVLAIVFFRFPPLTTIAGIVTLVAAPALLGRWALRTAAVPHSSVRAAAFFTVALPLLVVGLYYYFSFAPGPHSFGQYVLAVAPAALGGLAALAIAGVVLRASE